MLDASRLRGSLIPAVPAPLAAGGDIDRPAQRAYARWLAHEPAEGVAVWAHTGRGLRLNESQRAYVLECWREVMVPPRFVLAAAGASHDLIDPEKVIIAARTMARQACGGGADGLLVHPPVAFRGHPDQDALVRAYHEAVAEAGLPLVLFFLYEEAGGLSYGPALLRQLLAMPAVLGIKVATLDSVMTFQDIARLVADSAPGKVLITGEDRFLPYSLMCGAEAALIGMGAACTTLQARLIRAYREGRADEFLRLSGPVDDLARHTFRAPMEGYIQRMLWCLVHQGVIPREAAHDPWGPRLDPSEFDEIGRCVRRIHDECPPEGRRSP
ncbi:MAG: dihydrodipicolinate synthase family protein [Isosphaeraceae bacterium]